MIMASAPQMIIAIGLESSDNLIEKELGRGTGSASSCKRDCKRLTQTVTCKRLQINHFLGALKRNFGTNFRDVYQYDIQVSDETLIGGRLVGQS